MFVRANMRLFMRIFMFECVESDSFMQTKVAVIHIDNRNIIIEVFIPKHSLLELQYSPL